jgi:hypothetical protein
MRGNKLFQKVINYFIEQKIIVGISVLLAALLAVPFWGSGSLEIYDSPGHVGLVWYLKEHLWPNFSGWNPFFLTGWPQGIFYPSLFHWVSATLSFLIGIENSIKLIILLGILSVPFSAYYAVKNTITERKYWLPATFLVLVFLAVLPNFLGIGFRGLFQIGLIPNFISTPILLVFIGLVHSQLKKGKFIWSPLIFAVLILIHLVAAISAGIYLLIYSLTLWWSKELKTKSLILLIAISGLVTSFFWVPFLLNFSQTSVSAHVPSYFLPNIVLAIFSIALLLYSIRGRQSVAIALATFSSILLVLAAVDAWLINNAVGSSLFNILYPLHIYRFQPYAYLALILALGPSLTRIGWLKRERHFEVRFASIALFLILLVYLIVRNPIVSNASFALDSDPKIEGRFIESFRRTESDPLLYSAQTKLVTENPENNPWAYGLFTDSTQNGPYLGSLIRSLRPDAYPEGEGDLVETKFINEKNVEKAIDLFGIKYALNLNESKSCAEIGKWEATGEEKIYSVVKVGKGELAGVTNLNPIPVGSDFNKKVEEWWDKDGEWSTLPFSAKSTVENIDTAKFDPGTKVELVSHNEDWTNMKLNIVSEAPQPTLVKFSYFPWWKATVGSESVPIYQAAPNQMLIFANGEVDLEYKEPVWLKFLYLISVATLLLVAFQLVKKGKTKNS